MKECSTWNNDNSYPGRRKKGSTWNIEVFDWIPGLEFRRGSPGVDIIYILWYN
jgi:hypothetical protein